MPNQKNCKGDVLLVTDIHFNPFYDTTLVKTLNSSDYTQWEKIFNTSQIKSVSGYGYESNYILLDSLIKGMLLNCPVPDCILLAGDFLAHDFDIKFKNYTDCTSKYELNLFIYKTIAYIVSKLNRFYHHTPIYFTLGNNDSYEGDYAIARDGEFLHSTADIFFQNCIKDEENRAAFYPAYPVAGHYNVAAPMENCRIISMNSVYFSVNYSTPNSGPDPAREELQWLEDQLKECEQNNQKAWLLFHIIMGVNVYGSITDNVGLAAVTSARLQWKDDYNRQFIALFQKYSSVIAASVAGHIHMDDYRLIYDSQATTPQNSVHIVPAVTASFKNNPAFQIMQYDHETLAFTDFDTYYLDVSAGGTANPKKWAKEYNFTSEYAMDVLNPANLEKLIISIANDQPTRTKYYNYYSVKHNPPLVFDNWSKYRCGMFNLTAEDFIKCCNSGVKPPQHA